MQILTKSTFLRKHTPQNVANLHLWVYSQPILVHFSGQKWDFKYFSFPPIIKSMLSLFKLWKIVDLSISVHYSNFCCIQPVMSCSMLCQNVIIFVGSIVILKQATPHVIYHVSCVMCQVSGVMCQVSHIIQCISMDPSESQWIPMNPNRSQQIPIGPNWSQWIPMNPNGSWWFQMDLNGSWWFQMDLNGSKQIPMYPNESQWILMDPNESQWIPMDPNGSQCIPMHPNESKWIQIIPNWSPWI